MAQRTTQRVTQLLAVLVWVMLVTTTLVWWARPLEQARIEAAATGIQIDLNTAPAHELALLPGIGPRLAQRIIEDRQRAGAFRVATV